MNASFEKITIQSYDGAASRITVYPSHDSDAGVIICMPAMGVAARHYDPLAEALMGLGWNAITADLRGNGESHVRAGRGIDFGYHEMVSYDWPAIVDKVAIIFPHSKIILFGHSLGGQLSALYMARWPGKVSALILVAAPLVHYQGWPFHYAMGLLLLTQLARLVSGFIGYFPARWVGFGRRVARTVTIDWAHTVWTGRYEPKNTDVNYEELLPTLIAPILSVSFDDDSYAPRKATDNFCAKMTAADITRRHLDPQEIDQEKIGHMGFLKPCDPFLKMISDWLIKK